MCFGPVHKVLLAAKKQVPYGKISVTEAFSVFGLRKEIWCLILSGSSTLGTAGRRLRPKILDTISSL
jgi:hypothetical protein